MICPAEDDNGVKCQVEMTPQEIEQDGMCCRCADGVWGSINGFFFEIKNPNTREAQ